MLKSLPARVVGLFGVALLSLVAIGQQCVADPKEPQSTDRQVARIVVEGLAQHLTHHAIDDEISQRTFRLLFKHLDPMKMYFVQSDLDDFAQYEDRLDDMLKRGDLSFVYLAYNRLLKRVDERIMLIDELLRSEPDFTIDEEIDLDPKLATYAHSDAELREKWRKLIKYELLLKKLDKSAAEQPGEKTEPRDQVAKKYHGIAKARHQANADDLLEMCLTSLAGSFDPHTSYMSPSSNDQFESKMSLHYEGIGATLQYEYGSTKIAELVPGGAAEKDGRLKPGDMVVGVGQGRVGEMVDVADMNNSEIVKLIRGKAGTAVRLKVNPTTGGEPKIIDITRASIELKESEARGQIIPLKSDELPGSADPNHPSNGKLYKIGVIDLPSFYLDMEAARAGAKNFKSTTRDLQRILADFSANNVDAVVLDLRRNGGGSLTEAIHATGLFIDQGPIVQVKDAKGRVQSLDDTDRGVTWAGPLVVLQSKFSASASEIFAGAIQDYARGIVVGDRSSHGKGLVQTVYDISQALFAGSRNPPALGALKVTINQFYRPSGDSTQNRGVESDIELPSISSHLPVGESDLDYALKFDRVGASSNRRNSKKPENRLRDTSRFRCAKLDR